jgi:SAM-dependent methyltransferase
MSFDAAAPAFERYRSVPEEVPEAIRSAVLSHIAQQRPRILDIGAGTGRIGRAFVNAGDNYVGLDFSVPVLRESHSVNAMRGASRRGRVAVFRSDLRRSAVDSGRQRGARLDSHFNRSTPGAGHRSAPEVGHIVRPRDGVDLQLKEHLDSILHRRGMRIGQKMENRQHALDSLESASRRAEHSVVASWISSCTRRGNSETHRD